ncbi:hypothetical protein [Halobacteriovorax sp. DA5]|uniref:hypothetical protein n=1 Tax=Halobacteriovorax sp. DA5 TaxID=2067553 RepID=UPI000CD26940|nr:hypothetical protein [Halobacteriovorax sp. DA5]POB13204.1 hypothetical protein C0Z22_11870 [Halobacteriovorax sp. DA5]
MTKISTNEIIEKKLVDSHFFRLLKSPSYETNIKSPSFFLTNKRFDLGFKLTYLKYKNTKSQWPKDLYISHINAFSLGEFTEPGNPKKNNSEIFLESFDSITKDIAANGFREDESLIPINHNNIILNGAHRVSSAIHNKRTISTIQIDEPDPNYDYIFFKKRNVKQQYLDCAALSIIENKEDLFAAILWPSSNSKITDIEKLIPNIFYIKSINLNKNGAHNLLSQIYFEEEWIGSPQDNFKGCYGKLTECFQSNSPLRIVIFQSKNLNDVLKIKNKVRSFYKIGKHSIHITDDHEETLTTANILLNDNTVHFLNNAHPNKFLNFRKKISKLKEYINKNKINSEDLLIDTSSTLAIYGVRDANDIDILTRLPKTLFSDSDIDIHNDSIKFHQSSIEELITNPSNYFTYEGLKFLSLNRLKIFKENRNEIKDKLDLEMIERLVKKEKSALLVKLLHYLNFKLLKIRKVIIKTLKHIKLYNLVRFIYRKLKG